MALLIPAVEVLADLVPDIFVQVEDQAGFFQGGDEVRGLQPAQLLMIPAAEGFCTGDLTGFIVHLGLVPYLDIPGFQRCRKAVGDFGDVLSLFPLLRVVEFVAVAAHFPDFLFSHTRKIQHVVHVHFLVILRRQDVQATADLDPGFFTLIQEIIPHGVNYFMVIEIQFLFAADTAEDCETVGIDPAHGLLIRQGFSCLIRPEAQEIVTGIPAQTVIDIFEILDIYVGQKVRGVRMGAEKLHDSFPEAAHAENSGQGIVIDHLLEVFFVLFSNGVNPLHADDDQSHKEKENEKDENAIFV